MLCIGSGQVDDLERQVIDVVENHFPRDLARMILQYTGMFGSLCVNGRNYDVVERNPGISVCCTAVQQVACQRPIPLTTFMCVQLFPEQDMIMVGVLSNVSSSDFTKRMAEFQTFVQAFEKQFAKLQSNR